MPRSLDLIARLIADTKQFHAGMKDAEASVKKGAQGLRSAGRAAENAGRQMSRNVTLPLLAVGAAAVKLSTDFEATFAKMQGLAGVTAGEVEGLKKSVLGLAGETGKAPQELAEALYFIRSAGVEGSAALETLESSAKAAAAGLGSTVDIANAVTNALNAYGEANITAAEATDVLVATAREGKAEAADLAPQFGKLLPVASELGITFDQVGAGLAFLSRTSGSAELSATLLSNVMSKLLKPSKQAIDVLDSVGLTLDDVQKSIREDGLLNALQALREQLPREAFVKFFEDAQAVQGALAFTGATAEEAREVFKALEESAGATDSAFAAFAETAGFKNAQAFAKLQAAMIEVGDIIVPIVTDLVEAASALLSAFDKLPAPVKSGAVALAGFAAALGPILVVGGKITKFIADVPTKLDKFKNAAQGAASNAGKIGIGLGAVAAGAGIFILAMEHSAKRAQAMKDAARDLRREAEETGRTLEGVAIDKMARTFAESEGVRDAMDRLGVSFADLRTPMTGSAEDFERWSDAMFETSKNHTTNTNRVATLVGRIKELRGELALATEQDKAAASASKELSSAAGKVTIEINGTAQAFDNATDAAEAYTNSLRAQFDPYFGLLDALQKNRDAQADLAALQKSGKATAAELAAAQRGVATSALDVEGAATLLNAAISDQPGLAAAAQATLDRWVANGLVPSKQAAAQLAEQLGIATTAAGRLGNVDPTVDVRVNRSHLDMLLRDLNSAVSRRYLAHIEAKLLDGQRAMGGPVLSGRAYLVGEKGPELFVPSSSGNVIPNSGAPAMHQGTYSGGGDTIILQVGDRVLAKLYADGKVQAERRGIRA